MRRTSTPDMRPSYFAQPDLERLTLVNPKRTRELHQRLKPRGQHTPTLDVRNNVGRDASRPSEEGHAPPARPTRLAQLFA